MTSRKIASTNPALNYEFIGELEVSSPEEIAEAVGAAKEAFQNWRSLSIVERLRFAREVREAFISRIEEVAILQTTEMGKPLSESRDDCNGVASWMLWNIENAEQILEPQPLDESDECKTELYLEPYGVVAVIAPWNYPAFQLFLGSFQALIAGNAIVFKHSEECILTAKLIQGIIDSTSLPKGVFVSVYGDGEVGKELLEQNVDCVVFTGSSRVGEYVYQQAAKKFIPALLEMGGSSPGIIFADADIDTACESAFLERFSNGGQVCCALKRLMVHEDVFDKVVEKLSQIAAKQVIGNPLEEVTTLGPLVAKKQRMLLEEQVHDALEKGAKIIAGGRRPDDLMGAYYQATILTQVTADMRVFSEEVFGPVLPVVSFQTEDEAVRIANDTEYGLSAFVYTSDTGRAERVSKELKAGQVSINGACYLSDSAPFGGYKKSGIGRGGGKLGYYSVAQMKVVAKPT